MHLILLLYAFFASIFTIGKYTLSFSQPFFLIGTRMLTAGALMIAYQWFKNPDQLTVRKKDLWGLLFLGIIAIYLTNVCEFWGLQYLTSFKTCFIYSLSPFASALLCYLLFKDKLTSRKWLGLAIGCAGFIPILLSQGGSEELSGQLFIFSWAEIAVLVAALASVYGWILLGQLVKGGYSFITINGFSMILGGALALLHSYLVEEWSPIPVDQGMFLPFLGCTALLMIVSNLLAYNLYGHLLKRYSPPYLSFAGFTTPMFTVLFGWLFLGEIASWEFYLSAAVVFVGLALFHQEELKVEFQPE